MMLYNFLQKILKQFTGKMGECGHIHGKQFA